MITICGAWTSDACRCPIRSRTLSMASHPPWWMVITKWSAKMKWTSSVVTPSAAAPKTTMYMKSS